MSDIVERLRREATIMGMVGGDPVSRDMLRDAAAEIERLREERPKYCTVDGYPGRFEMLPLPAPPEEE